MCATFTSFSIYSMHAVTDFCLFFAHDFQVLIASPKDAVPPAPSAHDDPALLLQRLLQPRAEQVRSHESVWQQVTGACHVRLGTIKTIMNNNVGSIICP